MSSTLHSWIQSNAIHGLICFLHQTLRKHHLFVVFVSGTAGPPLKPPISLDATMSEFQRFLSRIAAHKVAATKSLYDFFLCVDYFIVIADLQIALFPFSPEI